MGTHRVWGFILRKHEGRICSLPIGVITSTVARNITSGFQRTETLNKNPEQEHPADVAET